MTSFLLGDEYASSSSSDDEPSPKNRTNTALSSAAALRAKAQLLPSVNEVFASAPRGVLTTNSVAAATHKRKNEQLSGPACKLAKMSEQPAYKSVIAPFAPPQLLRPNVSTEDRSSWNTATTQVLQRKAKKTQAWEK